MPRSWKQQTIRGRKKTGARAKEKKGQQNGLCAGLNEGGIRLGFSYGRAEAGAETTGVGKGNRVSHQTWKRENKKSTGLTAPKRGLIWQGNTVDAQNNRRNRKAEVGAEKGQLRGAGRAAHLRVHPKKKKGEERSRAQSGSLRRDAVGGSNVP